MNTMVNLFDAVRNHSTDLDPSLLERHFRRLPPAYFERHSAAEIAHHLHLLSDLKGPNPVAVEIRPLAAQAFDVLVVGEDLPGTVACITTALAAHGFNLEDMQVNSYLDMDGNAAAAEPTYFVILLRVSGSLRGYSVAELSGRLREQLHQAFSHLAEGNFLEGQRVAASAFETRAGLGRTPQRTSGSAASGIQEGLVLGGDFRLQEKLASGGMSDIYLATQLSLSRTVAVKIFHHQGRANDDLLARFSQETVVLGRFNCPYIVQVLAAGSAHSFGGSLLSWMAMEYMAGGDLGRFLERKGCPPVELATRWLREALEGLRYAHHQAILHRDLKPHNLLLTAEGNLKVSDFGLLKQVQEPAIGLTPRSAVLGTPHYMSPEQALGEALDERSDIFSLGTTFFHLVSGRLPFDKNSPPAVLLEITQRDAPSVLEVAPEVPRPLAILIGRMMARRREDRYQDVGVILEDLSSYERRGLLKGLDSGHITAAVPLSASDSPPEATQHYMPPPESPDDVVF
jgi:serine/threonine protein kinase